MGIVVRPEPPGEGRDLRALLRSARLRDHRGGGARAQDGLPDRAGPLRPARRRALSHGVRPPGGVVELGPARRGPRPASRRTSRRSSRDGCARPPSSGSGCTGGGEPPPSERPHTQRVSRDPQSRGRSRRNRPRKAPEGPPEGPPASQGPPPGRTRDRPGADPRSRAELGGRRRALPARPARPAPAASRPRASRSSPGRGWPGSTGRCPTSTPSARAAGTPPTSRPSSGAATTSPSSSRTPSAPPSCLWRAGDDASAGATPRTAAAPLLTRRCPRARCASGAAARCTTIGPCWKASASPSREPPDASLACPDGMGRAGPGPPRGRRAPRSRVNPGAFYGTAKRWRPERFAAAADLVARRAGARRRDRGRKGPGAAPRRGHSRSSSARPRASSAARRRLERPRRGPAAAPAASC